MLKVSAPDYLALLEFMTYFDESIERRLVLYAALAHHNRDVPVETALVLLRKEADSAKLQGLVQYGSGSLRYRIVRVWEMSKEQALKLPVSLLPIAPVADIGKDDLPALIDDMSAAFVNAGVAREREADLWIETFLLLGLKYDRELARSILEPVVQKMTESTTYQAIIEEGELKGERRALQIIGIHRFGEPSDIIRQKLAKITTSAQIEKLIQKALQVHSWDDLLQ